MGNIKFMTKRKLDIDELKEVLKLMENQETTDKFTNTELSINGDNAKINAKIDDDGNIEIL